jgi:hypothetical protein
LWNTGSAFEVVADTNGGPIFIVANSANPVAFYAGGFTERARVQSTGQFLVGTSTSPAGTGTWLAVNNAAGGGIELVNNNNGGGNISALSGGGLQFSTFTGAVGSEVYTPQILLSSSGNLSVGTTGVLSTALLSLNTQSATALATQSKVTASPANFDSQQFAVFSAQTATSGLTFSGSDPRLATLTVGTSNEILWRGGIMGLAAVSYLSFKTGGSAVDAMRVSSSGQLLVGTTSSPAGTGTWQVINNSAGGGIELANNNNGGGNISALVGGGLSFSTFTGAVGSEVYTPRMTVGSLGNVGINTTNPLSNLQVQGGIVNSNAVIVTNTYTVQPTIFGSVLELANGPYTVTLPVPTLYNGAWFDIWVNTVQTITLSTPQGNFYGPFGSSTTTVTLAQSKATWYRVASDGFNWFLTGFANMSQNGNLTLGSTQDYTSRLAIYQPTSNNPYIVMDVGAVGYRYTRYLTNNSARWDEGVDNGAESGSNAGSNWYLNRFSDTGVYLNTALVLTRGANTAAFTGALSATGEITAFASDRRLKDNVTPITNALDKVIAINGVVFDWNSTAERVGISQYTKHDVGVIAQEVQDVLPEAIRLAPFDQDPEYPTRSKSGENYLTVQYEKLTALLIEAIKEQQILIDDLTARVVLLESIIKA